MVHLGSVVQPLTQKKHKNLANPQRTSCQGLGLNPVCVMEEVGALLVAKAHPMVQQTSERWVLRCWDLWCPDTEVIYKKHGNRVAPQFACRFGVLSLFRVRPNQLVMAKRQLDEDGNSDLQQGHPSCKVEKIILKRFCVYHLDPFS